MCWTGKDISVLNTYLLGVANVSLLWEMVTMREMVHVLGQRIYGNFNLDAIHSF